MATLPVQDFAPGTVFNFYGTEIEVDVIEQVSDAGTGFGSGMHAHVEGHDAKGHVREFELSNRSEFEVMS